MSRGGGSGRAGRARVRSAWRAVVAGDVDLSTTVGPVHLPNPVMTASGTAGLGDELSAYLPLSSLGAVVAKSVSARPWPGNPAPRVHQTPSGMLNSVGLQGPGVAVWIRDDLPRLRATQARVVASIWGGRVEEFAEAAALLAGVEGLEAIEVNVSCPNVEDRRRMFAHSPVATAQVLRAVGAEISLPLWAKLSPNVADLVEIAAAAEAAGASAVTLINTVLGMAIDIEQRRPVLGAGGGGLSGAAVHPVAVRAVFDVRAALPELPIIGVGGIMSGQDAVELLMAGANAVQVGTASFRDPRAPRKILEQLETWCARRGVRRVSDLIGAAHG
jgi:dihydroorotate dehydrogenase (NAD+) catalytic subunit